MVKIPILMCLPSTTASEYHTSDTRLFLNWKNNTKNSFEFHVRWWRRRCHLVAFLMISRGFSCWISCVLLSLLITSSQFPRVCEVEVYFFHHPLSPLSLSLRLFMKTSFICSRAESSARELFSTTLAESSRRGWEYNTTSREAEAREEKKTLKNLISLINEKRI